MIPPFIPAEQKEALQKAERRLFLIAIESTLVVQEPKAMRDEGFSVPDEVIQLVRKIAADEKNVVYLLSGLPVEGVLDKVAAALPDAGFM